jgi:hypothetical protein
MVSSEDILDETTYEEVWVMCSGSENGALILKGDDDLAFGPVFFLSKEQGQAQIDVLDKDLIPQNLTLDNIPTTLLLRHVLEAFQGGTDLIMVNAIKYPFTLRGAQHVDDRESALSGKKSTFWQDFWTEGQIDTPPLVLRAIVTGIETQTNVPVSIIEEELSPSDLDKVKEATLDLVESAVIFVAVPETTLEHTFWVHTLGLHSFGRPELELRHVPAMFVGEAKLQLHWWSALSVDAPLSPGDKLLDSTPFLVTLGVYESADPAWESKDKGLGALTLRVENVVFDENTSESDSPLN